MPTPTPTQPSHTQYGEAGLKHQKSCRPSLSTHEYSPHAHAYTHATVPHTVRRGGLETPKELPSFTFNARIQYTCTRLHPRNRPTHSTERGGGKTTRAARLHFLPTNTGHTETPPPT